MSKNVSYRKPEEPSFLRKIKEQIGYKEGPDVDTKRKELEAATDEDLCDREEEKPVVVVLKSGDLTEEEADALRKEGVDERAPVTEDGRILFRKPKKRSVAATNEEKLGKQEDGRKKKKKGDKDGRKVRNPSLLSFDDDENDV